MRTTTQPSAEILLVCFQTGYGKVLCVRWGGIFLSGIVSPMQALGRDIFYRLFYLLFRPYMDTLIKRLRSSGLGCKVVDKYYRCLVYADDILLLSYTASATRVMLEIRDEFDIDFDHGLRGSASPVSTATGFVNGR